jgi:hypothetical protein
LVKLGQVVKLAGNIVFMLGVPAQGVATTGFALARYAMVPPGALEQGQHPLK